MQLFFIRTGITVPIETAGFELKNLIHPDMKVTAARKTKNGDNIKPAAVPKRHCRGFNSMDQLSLGPT